MPRASTLLPAYSCEFSPLRPGRVAVATAQHFGFAGGGRLQVFDAVAGALSPVAAWPTGEGVFDVAWSEGQERVLATAQGDSTVKLFDEERPAGHIASLEGHTAEVYSVDWNASAKHLVASASWDHSVKVWDASRGASVSTHACHSEIAYAAVWSPARPLCIASVAGDCMLHITDCAAGGAPAQSLKAHEHEILTVDWSQYDEFQVVTGSVDKTLRVFDLRKLSSPVVSLYGHQMAVRRVKSHPHCSSQVISASYDFAVHVWDLRLGQLLRHFDHHSDFVLGVDLNPFVENEAISAAWDNTLCLWNCADCPPHRPSDRELPPQKAAL